MRFSTAIAFTTLASSLVACATDGTDQDPVDDVDEVPVDNVAACLLPSQPPAADFTFHLDPNDWPLIKQVHDYGTGECSDFVAQIYGYGETMAQVTTQTSDPYACVHTSINVIRWYKPSGLPQGSPPWAHATPVTLYGEWTASGCKLPVYKFVQSMEQRYQFKAARQTCAGQFCANTYGFPFLLTSAPLGI